MNTLWTPQEDAMLIKLFASGKDITKDVMPFLPGRTYYAIRTRANEHLGIKMKKLPVHDNTFFSVPNEVNCNIAGFIAADGCVSDRGRFTLTLAQKDRIHVETVVRLLGFTGNIYDYSKNYAVVVKKYGKEMPYEGTIHTSTIQIQCPELCADLLKHWNITPRKTHTLCPPNLTDIRFIVSYLSGLIDGDGWIVNEKEDELGVYSCSIGIVGNRKMIAWVKGIFDSLVPNSSNAQLQPTESENIRDYKASGAKAYWLAKIFLSLDIPRLDRKWDKMRTVIARIESGGVSAKYKTNVAACRPSEAVFAMFGLSVPPVSITPSLPTFSTPSAPEPPAPSVSPPVLGSNLTYSFSLT